MAVREAFRAPPLHAAAGEDPVMRKGGGWKKWKRREGRKRAESVALNRMVMRQRRAA